MEGEKSRVLQKLDKSTSLFSPFLRRRTLFAMFLLIVLNIGVYGFNSWLPAILVKQGLGIAQSLSMTVVVSAGSIIGAVLTSLFSDRFSSKKYIFLSALLTCISAIFFASVHSNSALMVAGFFFETFLYCLVVMGWAVCIPTLFPTNVRMRGTGLANAAGRFASIIVSYIIAAMPPLYGFSGVVWGISGLFFLTAILGIWFGIDVHGKSLEQLNGQDENGLPSSESQPGVPVDMSVS